jgi:hypothetical protein
VSGVDRERREHREDLIQELLAQLDLAGRAVFVAHDPDVIRSEALPDVHECLRMECLELQDPVPDPLQDLRRGQPVGRGHRVARRDLLLEPGDPHLEELVEVLGEDREESGPLQQRVAVVLRLEQHPAVELEPRQLAVDVRHAGRHARRCPAGRRRAQGGHVS